MDARNGGEVYRSLCLFEAADDASECSDGPLRHGFGLEEFARRNDEEASSRHGLDMAVGDEG